MAIARPLHRRDVTGRERDGNATRPREHCLVEA
jgi:hypothetical protein